MLSEIYVQATSVRKLFDFSQLFEVWNFRDLFLILVARDIRLKYKQTFLGVAWVIFQPLISTVIFTLLFGRVGSFITSQLPYPVFAYLGLLYWTFFSNAFVSVSSSMMGIESLLKKVYFPKLIVPLSTLVVNFLDFFVGLIILVPFLFVFNVKSTPLFWISLLMGFAIVSAMVLGLGLFLSTVSVRYRDVRFILPFFTQVFIFLTPVFYPLSIVSPMFRFILSFNPLGMVIDLSRSLLIPSSQIAILPIVVGTFAAFLILIFGVLYFRKAEVYFADIL